MAEIAPDITSPSMNDKLPAPDVTVSGTCDSVNCTSIVVTAYRTDGNGQLYQVGQSDTVPCDNGAFTARVTGIPAHATDPVTIKACCGSLCHDITILVQ